MLQMPVVRRIDCWLGVANRFWLLTRLLQQSSYSEDSRPIASGVICYDCVIPLSLTSGSMGRFCIAVTGASHVNKYDGLVKEWYDLRASCSRLEQCERMAATWRKYNTQRGLSGVKFCTTIWLRSGRRELLLANIQPVSPIQLLEAYAS